MTKKPERKQLHAWVDLEIKERLEQWKLDHKSTYSEILNEALASYFSMTPEAKYFAALDAKMEQMEAKIDHLADALSSQKCTIEKISTNSAQKVERSKQVDHVEEVETKEEVSRRVEELERAKQQARQKAQRAKLAKQRAAKAKQDELRVQRAEKARQAQLAEELEQDKTSEIRASDLPKPSRIIQRKSRQKD